MSRVRWRLVLPQMKDFHIHAVSSGIGQVFKPTAAKLQYLSETMHGFDFAVQDDHRVCFELHSAEMRQSQASRLPLH
ncbi:MAG: hypothetical protein WBQ94_22485 [Terracidiphilus sp.]